MPQYYIESDGQVFLVEEEDRFCFPHTLDGLHFPIEIKHKMVIENQEIFFCKPKLQKHPEDWWHKDKIPGVDRVDPLVRLAVNASLPRVTAKAIVVKDGKILMVKPKRGFNLGRWALPGGFVGYGEPPDEAVAREVEEETGVACQVKEFLGVESTLGSKTSFHWHTFFFSASLAGENFKPASDEIESVGWLDLKTALDSLGLYSKIREKLKALYG
ncbi:NUDIX hydrolase [Candidatus Acetothermia bacterium]|nr:NUDIX hydrolase [Candidatus Acetothermia bacterium]MBI3659903.1 NUDIX hydrolase [Candidatus Acetothermia bacterium]